MGMKKDLAFHKPHIEQSIPLKLPEGKGGTDVDVEANDVAVFIVEMLVHRDADAINILGEFITGRAFSMVMQPIEDIRLIGRMPSEC